MIHDVLLKSKCFLFAIQINKHPRTIKYILVSIAMLLLTLQKKKEDFKLIMSAGSYRDGHKFDKKSNDNEVIQFINKP